MTNNTTQLEVTQVPHEYGPSLVGHGFAQCKCCYGTASENAVIAPNHCDQRAIKDTAWNTRAEQSASPSGLDAKALFDLVRPIWHYAPKGTGDGNMFQASERGQMLMRSMEKIAALAAPATADDATPSLPNEDVRKLIEPFADYHGDLPDFDHPLRCVYESGIQYAVELLAKVLKVEDYEICDGTEEFDGDLGGTMFNIVLEAMPKDADGDPMHPAEVRAALSAQPATADGEQIAESANCSTPPASEPQPASNDAVRETRRVIAAANIIDRMMGGDRTWRERLTDSSFLESADWATALEYADAALTPPLAADEQTGVDRTGEGLRAALDRQCDNMAFLLNHVDVPKNWYFKLTKELVADREILSITPAPPSGDEGLVEAEADGWERGMRDAANICGSLAETTYDDSDAFEAATGCEAAIIYDLRSHQRNRSRPPANEVAPANGGEGA